MRGVLLLPLLEDPVRVELAGVIHLLDIRTRGLLHAHPSQSGNALADGGQVVEEGRGAMLLAEVLDGADLRGGWLQQLGLLGLGRLGDLGGQRHILQLGTDEGESEYFSRYVGG